MDYQTLYTKTVVELRKLAKDMQFKLPAGVSKAQICEMLANAPESESPAETSSQEAPRKRGRPRKNISEQPVETSANTEDTPEPAEKKEPVQDSNTAENPSLHHYTLHRANPGTADRNNCAHFRPQRTFVPQRINRPGCRPIQNEQPSGEAASSKGEYNTNNQAVIDMLSSGGCNEGAGILEIQPDGYGFLRASNYLPGTSDVYISMAQIHRFALRNGDYVEGKTRPQREGDRYSAMMYIDRVNGMTPDQNARRPKFEYLVPVYPDKRLRLETSGDNSDMALRLVDILAPIGKGQRGMIVSPPKAGKTTLLKKIANAITRNHPEAHLIVLLIDERPEEVTDMKRSISGEVVYSTFDEAPENHTRVSEMVLERAQRLVEHGKDVVILMDSITRLARAYNLVIPPTGRSLSGGLDPGALHKPKRFFGAARNIENGGSLTIIATALVDTGSRMDDIIFEEFKGTGNMELHLDRKLSDRRIFPAIDMYKSGTRREELLLTPSELEGEYQARKMLGSSGNQEAVEQLISSIEKTASNEEFFSRIKGWAKAFEKDGFSLSSKQR